MQKELMRIGVSLPANLLDRFDEIIARRGYSSRSEGIRDAIRSYIVDYEWMSEQKGDRVGTITLIFDHNQRGLVDELTDIEHEYSRLIESSLHVHLDEDNCLEVILVRGESQEVKNIVEKMMALKGVKHVKLTTTSPGEGL
ncbi:MAG: nickel-responsive transcriptional regulator NikR [Methanocellales archaeon]|nr:nickel-responsive transcriptional regulator NikR [Methanocellales archaeon]